MKDRTNGWIRQRMARVGSVAFVTVLGLVILLLIPEWLPRPFLGSASNP